MEVTDGWTDTDTGPLDTPPAVAVMVAVPLIGLLWASKPLHTTKIESQTPAHTWPDGEIVAILVFDELKVKMVLTVELAEFTAETLSPTTCPATRESEAGLTVTAATVLFADLDPPQPAMIERKVTIRAASAKCGRRSFIPCVWRNT